MAVGEAATPPALLVPPGPLAAGPVSLPGLAVSSSPTARRILLLGFGRVGREVARQLLRGGHGRRDFPWVVVGIADSQGSVVDPEGVDLVAALRTKERRGTLASPLARGPGGVALIRELRPDVVVEVSVADRRSGEPGTSHVVAALDAGADVVTSNKGPLALGAREVHRAMLRSGRRVRYGTTVGGIVPVLETLVERLPTADVRRIRAVLNGTCQFVLGQLGEGVPLPEAVRRAQAAGLAEPDPSRDLDGLDAALKATILHNTLFAPPLGVDEVPREGIGPEVAPIVEQARALGRTVVMEAIIEAGRAEVHLTEVPQDSLWAAPGAVNTFEITTGASGSLLLQGRGAGALETATGLLADLLALTPDPKADCRSAAPCRAHPWIARSSWPPAVPPAAPPGGRRGFGGDRAPSASPDLPPGRTARASREPCRW